MMAITQTNRLIEYLRRSVLCEGTGKTDGELLNAFVDHKDDVALAALVRRHGPMVWGVCCRMLRSQHDAEDAFQAAFLVFVQKATTLPDKEMVGNWLYGVAHQTAVRMRALAAKRGVREKQVAVMPEPTSAEQYVWNDLQPILDEELARLADKYRTAIVLCDLEGKTRKDVARQLGIPEGTVASRLATARTMLAKRLTRRGIVVSGVLLGTMLSSHAASACVPMAVVSSTIKAATVVAAGTGLAGAVSPTVASLIKGVTKAMFMSKIKSVLALVVIITGLGLGGTGIGVFNGSAATAQAAADGKTEAAQPAPMVKPKVGNDEAVNKLLEMHRNLKMVNNCFACHADPKQDKGNADLKAVELKSLVGIAVRMEAGKSMLLDTNKQAVYLTTGDDTKGEVTYRIVKSTVIVRSDNGKAARLADIKIGDTVSVVHENGSQEVRCMVVGVVADFNRLAALKTGLTQPGKIEDLPKDHAELQKLQGKWRLVRWTTRDGSKDLLAEMTEAERKSISFHIRGEVSDFRINGNLDRQVIRLDPNAKPAAIDMTRPKGPAVGPTDVTFFGIYKLDADRLTISLAANGKVRPKAFDEENDDRFGSIFVYERELAEDDGKKKKREDAERAAATAALRAAQIAKQDVELAKLNAEKAKQPDGTSATKKPDLGVIRLGAKRDDIVSKYGKPEKTVKFASGIESLHFQHGPDLLLMVEVAPKTEQVIQIYYRQKTPFTAAQITELLKYNAEKSKWLLPEISDAGFQRCERLDGGTARGGRVGQDYQLAVLSANARPNAKP